MRTCHSWRATRRFAAWKMVSSALGHRPGASSSPQARHQPPSPWTAAHQQS